MKKDQKVGDHVAWNSEAARVEGIMSVTRRQVHTLTPFAKVLGAEITYPTPSLRSRPKKDKP